MVYLTHAIFLVIGLGAGFVAGMCCTLYAIKRVDERAAVTEIMRRRDPEWRYEERKESDQ